MALFSQTTQDFIPVKEIRDGIVVLNDGGMRMVLMATSINFALKSADEQASILMQYGNFLNSLDFSIQIFAQSTKLDIRPYLNTLEDRLKEQTADLLKIQTREYIDFIKNFVDTVNIMSKTFYVVVPFDSTAIIGRNTSGINFTSLFGSKKKKREQELFTFEEQRTQLEQRASAVAGGLSAIGVRTAQLGTEELVELYFKIFNPGDLTTPKLGSIEE